MAHAEVASSCVAAKNYTAIMTGANMVPPVNTAANGTTLLEWKGSKDNTLDYVVTVFNLVRLSMPGNSWSTMKIHTVQHACIILSC